jgi:hypothetical protein
VFLKQYGYGLRNIDRKNTCSREQLKNCDSTISPSNFLDILDKNIPPEFSNLVIKIDNQEYIPIDKIYFSQKIITSTFDNNKEYMTHNLQSTLCALIHNTITIDQLPPLSIGIFRHNNTYKFISFDNRRLCVYNYYKLHTNNNINIPIKFIERENIETELKKIYISCNILDNTPYCSSVGLNISDILIKYCGLFISSDVYYARIFDSVSSDNCEKLASISLHKLSTTIQKINNLKDTDNSHMLTQLLKNLEKIKKDINNKYDFQLNDALQYLSRIDETHPIYTNIKNELKLLDKIMNKYNDLLSTIIR